LLSERLGIPFVPQNIFRLTKDDDESSKKLRLLIESALAGKTQSPLLGSRKDKKTIRAEIRLSKVPKAGGKTEARRIDCNMEETKSNHSINTAYNKAHKLVDIFDKFEIADVKADSVFYQQSSKSVMLTIRVISEEKAKRQLQYLNSI
jgi:hypothetical protein